MYFLLRQSNSLYVYIWILKGGGHFNLIMNIFDFVPDCILGIFPYNAIYRLPCKRFLLSVSYQSRVRFFGMIAINHQIEFVLSCLKHVFYFKNPYHWSHKTPKYISLSYRYTLNAIIKLFPSLHKTQITSLIQVLCCFDIKLWVYFFVHFHYDLFIFCCTCWCIKRIYVEIQKF